MEIIAHIENGFDEKFGVPRQSGLASCTSRIVFEEKYRDISALRGLDGFSHLWLIWGFSINGPRWEPTVRPPRLGGNRRMGLWATRSPFRPNQLGLSAVRLCGIGTTGEGLPYLEVSGADLVNGSPIYDIKPYIPYTDSIPDASSGWLKEAKESRLGVEWKCAAPDFRPELDEILSLDPRPSYIDDPERIFGMNYRGLNIRFKVNGDILCVISAEANKDR